MVVAVEPVGDTLPLPLPPESARGRSGGPELRKSMRSAVCEDKPVRARGRPPMPEPARFEFGWMSSSDRSSKSIESWLIVWCKFFLWIDPVMALAVFGPLEILAFLACEGSIASALTEPFRASPTRLATDDTGDIVCDTL